MSYNEYMQVTSEQRQQLENFRIRLKLRLVVAYGSRVTGSMRKDSDLDIAVMAENKPDYELFKHVYGELSDIFKGVEVDVRFLNDADPLYMMQVVKNGLLLAGNQGAFDDLKVYTNRRYIDDGRKFFPFRDELLKEQQRRLRSQI